MRKFDLRLVTGDTSADDVRLSPDRVAKLIASGHYLRDSAFDRFLRDDLREASFRHWTPMVVALKVAAWLDEAGVTTVVDIGSGVGKFCIVAAMASRCSFTGIEHRPRFVEAADALAHLFGVEHRVQFTVGAIEPATIPSAEAYYLYNPFGENLFDQEERLGDEVELGLLRYENDVSVMESFFDRAPAGTLVVKYNGFGGQMPPSYDRVHVDPTLPSLLRMWRKRG
jgi:SAM-dependent methyltransferase